MPAIPGGVGSALTRKIGPLPAWGWGVGIGGVLLAVKLMRGGGAKSGGGKVASAETVLIPTGAPSIPHDYIGQLGQAVSEIRDKLGGITTRLDEIEVMPGPAAEPGTPVEPPSAAPTGPPVSAKPTRAFFATAKQTVETVFADVLGRGPQTGEEVSPWVVQAESLLQAGQTPNAVYSALAQQLSPYRQTALAGNPIPAPAAA